MKTFFKIGLIGVVILLTILGLPNIEQISEISFKEQALNRIEEAKFRIEEIKEHLENLKIISQVTDHEVLIFDFERTSTGVCTGTLIKVVDNTSIILTAKHCIGVSEEVVIENHRVKNIKVSVSQDLALLTIEGTIDSKKVAVLSSKNATIKTQIYGLGYANSKDFPLIGKVLVTTNKKKHFVRMIVKGGCSGAGVFTEDLKLIGVVTARIGGFDLGIYIPIESVFEFFEEVGYEG